MAQLILPPKPGGLTIRNVAHGSPDAFTLFSTTTFASGNGHLDARGVARLLYATRGNTALDSRQGVNMSGNETLAQADADALGFPFAVPWAWNARFLNLEHAAQGSLWLGFGEVPNIAAPHTGWRTNAAVKRAGILMERDAGGVVTWYMVLCNGATVEASPFTTAPLVDGTDLRAWITLLFRPNTDPTPGLFMYKNGVLLKSLATSLPTGGHANSFVFSIGSWSVTIVGVGNPAVLWRWMHPSLLPFTTQSAV